MLNQSIKPIKLNTIAYRLVCSRYHDHDHFCLVLTFQIAYILLRSLDPTNSGEISEDKFRKIMTNKEGVPDEDVDEMIQGDLNAT